MDTGIRILVIDDEIRVLALLKVSLEEYGFSVHTAPSGKEGIVLAQTLVPQAVILDVRMPEMDGWETCRELKKHTETKDIPVIFLTALSEKRNMDKARDMGAALFLTKPIDPYYLANKIKNIVEEGTLNGL